MGSEKFTAVEACKMHDAIKEVSEAGFYGTVIDDHTIHPDVEILLRREGYVVRYDHEISGNIIDWGNA